MTSEVEHGLAALTAGAEDLLADLGTGGAELIGPTQERLSDSVIGPLRRLIGAAAAGEASGGTGQLADRLWELAREATVLLGTQGEIAEVAEATAALQDLAIALTDESARAGRLAELAGLQEQLSVRIQVVSDGPYVLVNARDVSDYLGTSIPTRPLMALCRCGQSAIKPACDGACHRSGFTDGKDPGRVPDRRERYVGQQVTVLDNRGVCQHAGYCTDRLAGVFHAGAEPFVTASGGRMDEIIRAVRDCPSGALSYAIDGVEARDQVDHARRRDPAVTVSKDGPYRVTGGIALVDGGGADVVRNRGASREHYALCRCGQSQNKPFCSGMHWYVNFTDPVPDSASTPSMFQWAGGLGALERMTRLFYEKHVPGDPLLGPLFATMSADHPQRVAAWLGEVFDGPSRYSEDYGGYPRMISQHVGKCLTEDQRARWVALLMQSAKEAGLPNDAEFRSAFGSYIEWGSRLAVENSQTNARPPEHMPMPRWDWSTTAGPPGSRIAAAAPTDEPVEELPLVLPGDNEPVGYEKHIKALFRAQDRRSMRFAFDLWSYDDVRTHAEAILDRVRNGSMPCDGAWPAEKIDAFARWVSDGTPA